MVMFLMQDVDELKRFVVTTKKRNLCGNLLKLTAETITRFCSKGMLDACQSIPIPVSVALDPYGLWYGCLF